MPQEATFDLYDDRWRDCWVAATSTARMRKKQVDIDIQQRVARLLQDHGPQTERPLTLRVYGTMLKGFCILNNERAQKLFCDCERVVLMFAQQPFTEGDSKIRLPAAKRQRMNAALTLDLDLARVEASEAFDWTQAPLEEGALLRLGGQLPEEAMLPPCIELDQAMPQLLEPSACEAVGISKAGAESGWLPRFGGGAFDEQAGQHDAPKPEEQMLDPLSSQLVAMGEVQTVGELQAPQLQEAAAPGLDLEALAAQASKRRCKERAAAALLRPGLVYGFDAEPMMSSREYDEWQQDASSLSRVRLRAADHADIMGDPFHRADHLGPRLRLLVDPVSSLFTQMPAAARIPEVQSLLGGGVPDCQEQAAPQPDTEAAAALASLAESNAIEGLLANAAPLDEPDVPRATVSEDVDMAFAGLSAVEAQDDRTAEVGEIIRRCLRDDAKHVAAFDHLVPPGGSDRATAACTFAAILALASAGELVVKQSEPYAPILIAEAGFE
eukprot:TRINITY_DN105908_c0_g1_i1.p1 TRINITY_DN105908_c0_g1~~TRINITY_DN105908_c0_g1_i1.p1  ORF type:complete len:521 (-),score=126.62 TRINITY_DN105908_c0_g1_i1:71-1561(-)